MDERGATKARRSRCLTWVAVLLTIGLAAGAALLGFVLREEAEADSAALPPNVGNGARVTALLAPVPADRATYRFGVVGDSRNTGIYEQIMQVLGDGSLSFLVNLGDFVNDGTFQEHEFFAREMQEMELPCPMFLVVGNHDVGQEFGLEDFHERYGPTRFAFRYGGDLFLVLPFVRGVAVGGCEAWVDEVLTRERGSVRYVFVFTHTPPLQRPDFYKVGSADPSRLIGLFEAHHVTYVISGDLHGYRRAEQNGVRYLVTGGGGGRLDKRSPFGRFHHAVVLKVDGDGVTERILPMRPSLPHVFEDGMDLWAVVSAVPWLRRYWFLAGIGGLVWLILTAACWRHRLRPRPVVADAHMMAGG
jgi:hypothetical protein